MWIFCGLGNPGKEYQNTRHNFGFLVLDAYAKKKGLSFEFSPHLEADIAFYRSKALLVKPQTYMNLSGRAVVKILKNFEISPQHLLVIHDDLDLPLGRIKVVPKGGAGGHRGVISIIEALGSEDFPRMKLGIGRPKDQEVKEYVLSPFREEEVPFVNRVIEKAQEALEEILFLGFSKAMSRINSLREL
ncbi:MAG: aminoacyl-tRNA hydrolase [Caldimicrobium sp.]|nr:aminoacyl-tRNA hydrolase [Caldimicrobium sp.]MCX7873515.1 aminoacyl-tRNA hydrolase [Caldimicrobium sp.]MDW8093841.1 aminoacyl-tRNA hydrolase [Caldimicrobium sp.]